MNKTTADPLVGKTVAQYEVAAKLGGGGMGIVYAARDTKLGRRVALKFLPPQWSHDESAKQRFIREAQAASATDHRNICTIHDIDAADDGQLFIVMAHYEGQTLKQRLEAGALTVDEALDIAAQVTEGLAKAHAQGVVHRDIKPGNLMLTEDGVKILDFGLAKFADVRFKLTQEGSTLGTVAYMSPEQARGEEADHRSDIWATGVVLYEMLSGELPFKGGYPEAISHAIKNDAPPPLRRPGGDPAISEALEQLVFRALHKSPSVRFQSARDLARALRQLQGRTIPLDLRTEPLPLIDTSHPDAAYSDAGRVFTRRRCWWATRAGIGVTAAIVALTVGTPLWLASPIERVPVAIAPVVNQTGDAELDPYRLALTQELIAALADSRSIRVIPYDRTLQIVRRFGGDGGDVSSREAVQALTGNTGAPIVILPTLTRENGAWKAHVDFRSADTATAEAGIETPSVVSSLKKETVQGLIGPLAAGIEQYFADAGPRRAWVAYRLRTLVSGAPSPQPTVRTLDAAAAFEQGVDAYEQQEHTLARRAFATAIEQDPRNPLLRAWHSRVAQVMGQDKEAADAASEATKLPASTSPREALFIAAVAAEASRDFPAAEVRYRELVKTFADEPTWVMELAGFQDRRGRTQADFTSAVTTYLQALALDSRLARPHLELCRLYNRLNDPPKAKEEGALALSAYQSLGAMAGQAQALWCLTDALRIGNNADRLEARKNADRALALIQPLGFSFNLARAQYDVGLAAVGQRQSAEAVQEWEESLATAVNAGNAVLEPLLLMNLGATHEQLGNPSRAAEFYQRSQIFYEGRGDETRAAQVQANRGALLIAYGPNPLEGFSAVQNALAVSQKLGDKTFELLCRRVIAEHHRINGRYAEAEAELSRALAIANERDLRTSIGTLTAERLQSRVEVSDYPAVLALSERAPMDSIGTHMALGTMHARLGDLEAAASDLAQADKLLQLRPDLRLLRQVNNARGIVALEAGRFDEARGFFEQSAAGWTDDVPQEASVVARAYVGLLDGIAGRADSGRAALRTVLAHAQKMGRFSVEARSRSYLARIEISQRRFADALTLLKDVPLDGQRAIGPELQAQVHYWRGQALLGQGDRAAGAAQLAAASKFLDDLRAKLPEAYRNSFALRPDIRMILDAAVPNSTRAR